MSNSNDPCAPQVVLHVCGISELPAELLPSQLSLFKKMHLKMYEMPPHLGPAAAAVAERARFIGMLLRCTRDSNLPLVDFHASLISRGPR